MESSVVSEKENWNEEWAKLDNTITIKNIFALIDEIKFEYLRHLIPAKGKSIEIGAGSARLSVHLSSIGYTTVAMDFSLEALRVARNNYQIKSKEGIFVIGDANNLPFKDGTFDVALSTGLLEHFEKPHIIVREMSRIIKSGGVFYSDIVPKKFSLLRSLDFIHKIFSYILHSNQQNDHFEKKLGQNDIIEILESTGLKNVIVYPAGVFPPRAIIPPARYPFSNLIQSLYNATTYNMRDFWKFFDESIIAEKMGFYYFCYGYKK